MSWLRRIGRPPSPGAPASDGAAADPVERAAPGVAALLDRVSEDRSHAVLDLGPAADSSLQVYSRFARWVRFADLLAAETSLEGWESALSTVPLQPERPYDLVFAWDILDRLGPEERLRLVERLAEISAPDARLHVVVEATEQPTAHPLRFTLLDIDRMRAEPVGSARSAQPPLLPAEVGRLLAPFQVVHAFNLKGGLREYVAVRREA